MLTTTRSAQRAVLIVGNFLSGSGGSRGVCEELALRLSDSGWRVSTTSSRRGRLARLAGMLSTAWKARDEYAVAQVDVYSGPAFLWAEVVCSSLRRLRKPYVLSLHGGNLPTFACRWPGRVRRLLGSARAVTAPSHYLLEFMRTYRADLCLLPNAIDISAYPFRLRRKPTPNIVWLRAFHGIYNPVLGPKIVALLHEEFPDITLTMVGPDKGDGSLSATRQAAEELGVLDRLCLPGGVPKCEVPDWLDRGDVFLNTTSVDNTPVSVIEAMSCGLCIASTDAGGLPYLLTHEEDALLTSTEDVEAMAAAVRRILKEPALAERLSGNARSKAERFDWNVVLPQWESLLASAVNGAL